MIQGNTHYKTKAGRTCFIIEWNADHVLWIGMIDGIYHFYDEDGLEIYGVDHLGVEPPAERMFPIARSGQLITAIPWAMAEEAYKEYTTQPGIRQSLYRLSQRGGLSALEIITLLYKRCFRLKVSGDDT